MVESSVGVFGEMAGHDIQRARNDAPTGDD